MIQDYEQPIEVPADEFNLIPSSSLSPEEKRKAAIVGAIIEEYTDGGKKDVDYGELFDRFFDKEISELIILRELFKK